MLLWSTTPAVLHICLSHICPFGHPSTRQSHMLGYWGKLDPLPVLCQNPCFFVKCNPSHGVRCLGALIVFPNPYAYSHCQCHITTAKCIWHALMQQNWLIILSFPSSSTKRLNTPTFYLFIFFACYFFLLLSSYYSCTLAAVPASVNWPYSTWLDLTWKLQATAIIAILETKSKEMEIGGGRRLRNRMSQAIPSMA